MNELQQANTVAVKACGSCAAALLERDKFCRWCGTRQEERVQASVDNAATLRQPIETADDGLIPATNLLAPAARADVYRRVSGPLVSAMVTGALAGTASETQGRFMKRITLALISIPIWLMIVLLSPLDAYAAMKNLVR